MRLLYYLHTLSLAGAQRSALALAREMRKHGCSVVFAGEVQGDAYTGILAREGFEHIDIRFSRKPADVWRIAHQLAALCANSGVDVCHAYYYTNYYFAWAASLLRKMPVIGGTFCGGPGPRYHIPRLSPVVVFSKEQKDAFIAKWGWKPENLVVSPGRVEHPVADATQPDRGDFLSRYGLTPELLSILFVSRLSEDKRGSVETIQLLAREIAARGLPWQVLIAGGGKMESELREFGDQLERQAGRTVLAAAGEQDRLDKFYACADVVAGVGRSIFDGMMRGKPAMVVGEKGFAGLVSPESVEALAYYNFSGRNAQADSGMEHLISAIHLAALPEERLRLGSFARRYTSENLSVGAGGKMLLEYYAQLMEFPPLPRARVLREVALSTISYVKRKSPYA